MLSLVIVEIFLFLEFWSFLSILLTGIFYTVIPVTKINLITGGSRIILIHFPPWRRRQKERIIWIGSGSLFPRIQDGAFPFPEQERTVVTDVSFYLFIASPERSRSSQRLCRWIAWSGYHIYVTGYSLILDTWFSSF